MSFLHPEYFYYFLPLVAIVFILVFVKKVVQTDYFTKEVMQKLRVGKNTLSTKMRNILYLVISVLVVIGLAEPVIKKGKVEVKSKSADIVIALDISDSMLAEDIYPNRLKFAKEKAMELLQIAPNERIGIIAFAKNSYLVSPMSFDHDAVGFLLRQLNTDSISEKGTNFLSLLEVVENTIKTTSKKHLLILSDGGDKNDFSKEIAYAKEKNILVFVLGIGTEKGAPIKQKNGSFITYKGEVIVSRLNKNIASFATSTGGVYIKSIKSKGDVKTMLREIESISQKKELKSEIIEKFIPLFYYPVGLALFLLLIATSSLQRNVSMFVIVLTMSFGNSQLKAAVFDFMDLEEAKVAYEDSNYSKAEGIYAKYALDTNNSQSYYNQGNALYKQNKFDEAMQVYQRVKFDDNLSQANTLSNIGNTYVKQAKEQALENAIKSYESSLELNEDKDVRENLEAVKKELEKQKEQEKKEDKKDDDKKDDSEDNKEGDKSEDSGENKDKSKDKKEDSNDKKEGEKSDDSQKSEEKPQNKEAKDKKEDSKNKDDLKELDKNESDSDGKSQDTPQKQEMSDAEQQKWLNQLNSEQNTYMYMLNNINNNEENSDEKPW